MSNPIYTTRLSGNVIMQIDDYEQKHYKKPSKLFERITKVLPSHGEVALLYVMASSLDNTVGIIHTVDGETTSKNLSILDKDSLGYLLFLHAFSTAPVVNALSLQYGFGYAYAFGQKLAANIIPGDQSTYPKFVDRIKPEMVTESEDFQLDMFRFAYVGESRDDEHTIAVRAIVRYTAISVDEGTSNNYREVFPVMQAGPYITFNSFVPTHANILGPFNDACILPVAKRMGLLASDSVMAINEDRVTISVKNGLNLEPEFETVTTGV